ncbi:MAG: asparagine synthase (glutamine-hydrolyzing) [Thermoplasmatota archaeon]
MCGIAGVLDPAGGVSQALAQATDALRHRGPDDAGSWTSADGAVGLGHRRLAIIDLSSAGHQPMASASGRYVIAFNGEVYNFERLRATLGSTARFRGGSDTEVMLAAFERWGVKDSIARFEGMFAFAVWDQVEGVLTLARDRLGKKPLYYTNGPGRLVFASELKAIRAASVPSSLDPAARDAFLHLGYVPGPGTIDAGIRKVPPGAFLHARPGVAPAEPVAYWAIAEVAARPRVAVDPAVALDRLEALLGDAVRDRMISDVPLGAFLSGGIDSSTVVALMAKSSAAPIRTFTIGWEDAGYDESPHARAVAQHLGTEHSETVVGVEDVLGMLDRLPVVYNEPLADASQIPTLLVCEAARRHVTVALSGDGGDEVFGGYNRYTHAPVAWHRMQRLPGPLRRMGAALAQAAPPQAVNVLGRILRPALPRFLHQAMLGDKLHKAGRMASAKTREEAYWVLATTGWPGPGRPPAPRAEGSLPFAEWMMLADAQGYLPEDILAKVDRASMAVALETRAPLLDHRVVEFAWSLPLDLRVRDGTTKWLLRRLLDRHVPRGLVERPKMGFAMPMDTWLRGPLRPWAEPLLETTRLHRSGLDAATVRRLWRQHQRGSHDWSPALWAVLTYQAWWERWMS